MLLDNLIQIFFRRKFRISEEDYKLIDKSVADALDFLLQTNEYQQGSLGKNLQAFNIHGSQITWIDPWIFLGAILESLKADATYREKISEYIKSKKDQYFESSSQEGEMALRQKDAIEYQYKIYEIILIGLFEAINGFGRFDGEDQLIIEKILTKISNRLLILEKNKAA
jgi:hypothetical protein